MWKTKSLDLSRSRVYLCTVVVVLLLGLASLVDVWFTSLILNYAYYSLVIRCEDINYVKTCMLFLVSFSFSPLAPLVPIMLRFFSLCEHEMLDVKTTEIVTWIVKSAVEGLEGIRPPMAFPITGLNSMDMPEPIREVLLKLKYEVEELFSELDWKSIFDHRIEMVYIREVGVNSCAVELADRGFARSRETYEKSLKYQQMQQWVGLALASTIGLLLFQNLYVVIALGLYILTVKLEHASALGVVGKRGPPVKNGIYKVESKCFGVPYTHGVGTCFNNVLHVPYHVCGYSEIVFGNQLLKPYYVSLEEDLVTYGGPPQFTRPGIGDELLINTETVESRTTYHSRVDVDASRSIISWCGVTSPGESGSPVLIRKGGELYLVGLGGRYVRDEKGETTEFAKLPFLEISEEVEEENHKKIVTHPGSGKTYNQIPTLVLNYLASNRDKRVLVTGPTRTVCRELWKSLSRHVRCGLNIKNEAYGRDPFARVQIAAHASALHMCLVGARELRNLGLIIIDEAHFDDSSTIMLRNYAAHWLDSGVKLVELSATLDGVISSESNFNIEDHKIKSSEVAGTVDRLVQEGKRVLVFVPSMTDRTCLEIVRRHPKAIRLSRKTFDEAMSKVDDLSRQVIVSTDIGECGVNFKELDCVVDTCEKFDYCLEGMVVVGKKRNITVPSRVQRRGRVGRKKEGEYYFVREAEDVAYETSAQLDADILMTGRTWGPLKGNRFGLYLSDAQVVKAISDGITPTLASLVLDNSGKRLDQHTFSRRLHQLRGGSEYYIGCKDNNCECKGTYLWFDERIHDYLFRKNVLPSIVKM